MRSAVITLCFLVGLICPSFGGLTWENTELSIDPGPLEEKIEAVFRFTNTGTGPTTITQTHASCGCTVPSLNKTTFAAGESGELRVVYTIAEGSVGQQDKMITVQTGDSSEETYLLTLSVNIPGLWDVRPKFVKWEHAEERAAKTITIRALYPELAKPVSVESRDARFATELRESPDEPGVFVVTITPTQTDAPMFTSVTVNTNAPVEKKRVVQVYAVVR